MLDDVQPSYSAQISPDFVALAAAEGLVSMPPGQSQTSSPDPTPPPTEEEALAEDVQPAAPPSAPCPDVFGSEPQEPDALWPTPEPPEGGLAWPLDWPVHRLRQDGGLPLEVQALCLFTHHDTPSVCRMGPDGAKTDHPVDRTITLYLKPDGTSLAHLACIPDADAPARPVHRIAEVTFAADLEGFLTHHGADLCFAVGAHPAWPIDGEPSLPLSPKLGASDDT